MKQHNAISKIKNKHRIKRKDIRKIISELRDMFSNEFFTDKDLVEEGYYKGKKIIFVNNEPCFMIHNNKIFFTLHGLIKYQPNKNYVIIDMGAIKFITNGADVMSAGIVKADINIQRGDQVWICDERFNKPIAVGIALKNGNEMITETKGKSIENIHYIGDTIWNIFSDIYE